MAPLLGPDPVWQQGLGDGVDDYVFRDGKLILHTPPMTIGGKPLNGELVWEKIESAKE